MYIVCRSVKQNNGKEMNEGIKNQFHDRTERLEESEPDYGDFETDNYHHEKKRIQGLCAVISNRHLYMRYSVPKVYKWENYQNH